MKLDLFPPQPEFDWALFLDFDGTLVEFADRPEAVAGDAELANLLRATERALDGSLAIVTGRPIQQIDRLLGRAIKVVAGQHGHELRTPDGFVHHRDIPHDALAAIRAKLNEFTEAHDGVLLEDKGRALALHYRQSPVHEEACDRLVRSLADESGGELVMLRGKMVREIKADGHDKGDAVAFLMAQTPFAGRRPVYAGDDITDEDAFAVVNGMGGLSIKVGDGDTLAAHRIATVADLRRWLAAFGSLKTPEGGR
ncbi:MAG: trehalose-phosphatase [Alphaproteobacteria bacterium]|nr:trehalose-phosphatase [Alphaproteobacteria bacterium]